MIGWYELLIMAFMISTNAIFAGYEIALASVSLARLERLHQEKQRSAEVTLYMKQNMEASLAVVQLAITLAGSIAAAVGGAGVGTRLVPWLESRLPIATGTAEILAIACVVLPLTGVTILVGELIPKVYALRHAESVCLKLSPFMRWITFLFRPIIWLFETVVTGIMAWSEQRIHPDSHSHSLHAVLQELRTSAALARAATLISHREESIILGAAEMQVRPLRDIMLSVAHICTLDLEASLEDNVLATQRDLHTRFPVEAEVGNPQSIIGYVNVKDLVMAQGHSHITSLKEILRPLPELNDSEPITVGLEHLIRERTHIALVRDAQQQVVGMISLEDIIEELIGEIEDEYDRLPTHLIAVGESWIVGGGVTLDTLQAVTGLPWRDERLFAPSASLNDWTEQHLKSPLHGGDELTTPDRHLVVRKVRRNQLQEAHISPIHKTAAG